MIFKKYISDNSVTIEWGKGKIIAVRHNALVDNPIDDKVYVAVQLADNTIISYWQNLLVDKRIPDCLQSLTTEARDYYSFLKELDILNSVTILQYPCSTLPLNSVKLNDITEIRACPSTSSKEYPHTCPKCGAPAYIGLTSIDCSKGCN